MPQEDVTSDVTKMPGAKLPTERTLRVKWGPDKDQFVFELNLDEKESTRRGVLSTIAGMFDPLGLIAPYVLSA